MNPLVCVAVSSLERAASLIEKGVPPAKAFRQVAMELREYESMFSGQNIPRESFAERLGVPTRRAS